MPNHDNPILIIGAGLGGLSAAIHLAVAGYAVVVLEQHATVGGKMSEYQADGFRWDTGPSVITMRPALEELFATAGRRMDDYVTLVPVEPITRYFFTDGAVIDATRDLPHMAEQIAQFNPNDVEGYLAFLAHAAALHRITTPVFIESDPPTMWDILRVPPRDMVKVDAVRTMDAAIRRGIQDQHLRHILRRYATYVGASPYRAPAVLNVIAHEELTAGVWYIQGGIYALAQAYAELARELGVEIRTEQRVTEIIVNSERRATGVRLADGTTVAGQAIVANVDVTTVYHDLLDQRITARPRQRLAHREPSLSGFVLLLGMEGVSESLAQHNILFPTNYRQEFRDIFQRGKPPEEPTIYISISARRDADHAPAGCENWFVLVNVPPLGLAGAREPSFDWQMEAARYRDVVLDRIETMGISVRDRLLSEHWLTPLDLARRTGAWRGALYGLSSNNPLAALRRPPPRDRRVRGLYFTGGTTHPGGGVPMVTRSGGVTARMVQADVDAGRGNV